MKNLNPLYSKIEELLSVKAKVLLAIDGNAASGKTSLATDLSKKYQGLVFHMDDFFLPPQLKTKDRLAKPGENIHWERFLQEILIPLKDNQEISYQKFNCHKNVFEGPIKVKPQKLIIVEGVYSLHPNLSSYYDIKIFLSLNEIFQKERLSKREKPLIFNRFLNEWLPLENIYFEAFNISSDCDFLLRGEELF